MIILDIVVLRIKIVYLNFKYAYKIWYLRRLDKEIASIKLKTLHLNKHKVK